MDRPIIRFAFVLGRVRSEIGSDGVTFWPHLQKYSTAGIMLNIVKRRWPFCLHVWYFWRKQAGNDQSGWIPGTEQGFYARTPGYREGKDGIEWTNGFLGLRWD